VWKRRTTMDWFVTKEEARDDDKRKRGED